MALWVYKKYNKQYSSWSEEKHNYSTVWGKGTTLPTFYGYPNKPYWDGNKYAVSGTPGNYDTAYTVDNGELRCEYRKKSYSIDSYDDPYIEWWYETDWWYRTRTVSKGDYVGEVIAEDGTYPDDGAHTDAYWYVKDRLAWIPPDIKIKVSGSLKTYENGWVRINGTLKQIDKVWIKANGQLREL